VYNRELIKYGRGFESLHENNNLRALKDKKLIGSKGVSYRENSMCKAWRQQNTGGI
jgi:hypothetical protein